jgi:hypothetical protein
MDDLEIAKNVLHRENLTLCIVKEMKVVIKSRDRGIRPFMDALENFGESLKGAAVADRVVGKALALLLGYAGITATYAQTLSLAAKSILEKYGIRFEYDRIVERILNVEGVDACPFERAVSNISNPLEAYLKIKELLRGI